MLGVFKKNPVLVRQIFGIVLIATAIFIYTGFERKLQTWFLDNLPESWTNLATTFENRSGVQRHLRESR